MGKPAVKGRPAAADAMLDDTFLPSLRSESRRDVLGMKFGWRAENRLLGYLKLAPVEQPRRLSAQLLVNRLTDSSRKRRSVSLNRSGR